MASIRRKVTIRAPAHKVWDALRDVGALHTRLEVGFVADCRLEGDTRIVKFSNGTTVREVIVDVDDDEQRVVWSATGGALRHHNASAQVFPMGADACMVTWIADVLPGEVAPAMARMVEQGLHAMKRTMEAVQAA